MDLFKNTKELLLFFYHYVNKVDSVIHSSIHHRLSTLREKHDTMHDEMF